MIQISTHRCGILVVALTLNDYGEARVTWGLTSESARRRLCRKGER